MHVYIYIFLNKVYCLINRFFVKFLDVCLEKGSKDNMTTLIVKMPAQVVGEGGGVAERRRVRMEAANEDEP